MITTTIRARTWPDRPTRALTGLGAGALTAYHLERQGLYAWAVLLFTIASTAFVLRALRPLGPVWSLIHGEDDPPCSSVTKRTGSAGSQP